MEILQPAEIARIERDFASGLPARTILQIFRPKGVRLSEATFRKYVQAGLLPRSKRVGTKGKHRGSHGVYPVESVRRINVIKKMMAAGLTLEEIKHSFVSVRNHLDEVERSFEDVFGALEGELALRPIRGRERREVKMQLTGLRRRARELMEDVARVGSELTARVAEARSGGTEARV